MNFLKKKSLKRRCMHLLVIDDEWPAKYSGKSLREVSTLKGLSDEARISFLCINIGGKTQRDENIIKGIFSSLYEIDISKSSLLKKIYKKILALYSKTILYSRWSDYSQYKKVKSYIEEIIKKENIEIIHVYSYFIAQYLFEIKNTFIIWDIGDSVHLYKKRQHIFHMTKKLYKYEQKAIRRFNRTIFVSPADASLHNNLKHKISVVPNGVDLAYYQPMKCDKAFPSLIFTGHLWFKPNAQAVIYFIRNILPLIRSKIPETKFYVVGANPPEKIKKMNGKNGIIVTGAVEDIRPYIAKATIYVCPMVSGSGLKNKVLEAMAMGKAIVSTPLGIEALNVVENDEILVANCPTDFANKTILLFNNETLRNNIGYHARLKVEKDYGWDKTTSTYKNIYNSLAAIKKEQAI